MQIRKHWKRILSLSLAVLIFVSECISTLAADVDYTNIAAGERVIVNMDGYCNPGASGVQDFMASPSYNYTFHTGHTANIHMGYMTKDFYSLGSPRHSTDGNIIWAYCMEFDVEAYAAADRTGSTYDTNIDRAWAKMSAGQRRGVMLTTLYGFPVNTYGFAAADIYAATQVIIWEFQTGVRTSTTSNTRQAVNYQYAYGGISGTVYLPENYFYNIIAVNSNGIAAYNTLISKIYSHDKQPSFAGQRIELNFDGNTGKYSKTLTDTNGVLSSYNVSADNGVSCSVSGNTLTLTASRYVNGANLNLTKKAQPTTAQGFLLMTPSPEGQSMVLGQRQVDVAYTYKVYALAGALKVQKRSSDGVVQGIKFNVVGPGVNTVLTTDASGSAILNNIPIGTYTVTEQMPDRYVKQDPKTVTVQGGLTSVAAFSNVVKSGDLIVLKIDSGTGKPVPGAQFELYDENDNHIATEMTNERGEATFKGVLYGNYYVFESLAPAGYKLSEKHFDFSITEQGQIVNETFDNENIMRNFGVYKKGEVLVGFDKSEVDGREVFTPRYEEKYLSGCEALVYALEDIFTGDGTCRYKKGELVDTLVTDEKGPVYTRDLFDGFYLVKEKNAPKGYVLSSETKEVALFDDMQEITFQNDRQKCSLTFKKSMSNTTFDGMSKYYKMVSFGVFNAEEICGLPAGSLLEIIKPNEKGDCAMTVDLPCGYKYYVKELGTASGFILDENSYFFSFMPFSQYETTYEASVNENNEVVNEMVPVEISRQVLGESGGPDTSDKLGDEAHLFITLAVSSLFLVIILFIRKKKLTLYH